MIVGREHQRIPSLDGLRAFSIFLVMFNHLVLGLDLPWSPRTLALFDVGRLGVKVFFVISGFLITTLLLDELGKTNTISLPRFYLRRTLRIFPPYYCFLAVMLVFYALGRISVNPREFVYAATYTSNYSQMTWNLGHTWSLSVEEQFYLLWPALLLLLGRRRGLFCAGAMLFLSPLARVYMPTTGRLETVADSLVCGCLLAGMRHQLLLDSRVTKLVKSNAFFLVSLAIVTLIELLASRPSLVPTRVFNLCLVSVQNLLIALMIHWCITNHQGVIGRVLNCAPLSFIGVISYSLYIWQQPFFNHFDPTWFTQFPVNVFCIATLAIISYYCVEQPSLELRRWLDAKFMRRRAEPAIVARD